MNKFLLEIPEQIETEHLYLRSYRAGDGPLLYAAGRRNRAHLAEFESENVLMHLKSEEHGEVIAQELAADWTARNCFFMGIFDKASDQWVGQVYVGPTNWDLPEFEIGFAADANFEGKGLMTEAVKGVLNLLFVVMGAHRVKSDCNENNNRSWRLLERCGFKRGGHLRENKKSPDGVFHGDYIYGLLRQDYFSR